MGRNRGGLLAGPSQPSLVARALLRRRLKRFADSLRLLLNFAKATVSVSAKRSIAIMRESRLVAVVVALTARMSSFCHGQQPFFAPVQMTSFVHCQAKVLVAPLDCAVGLNLPQHGLVHASIYGLATYWIQK